HTDSSFFTPGNLVVSRSVYDNNPGNVQVGQLLPPNCTTPPGGCGSAIQDGTYPFVWNNDSVDGSFGITSKIFWIRTTLGLSQHLRQPLSCFWLVLRRQLSYPKSETRKNLKTTQHNRASDNP